jgi:Sulfotransferase domain
MSHLTANGKGSYRPSGTNPDPSLRLPDFICVGPGRAGTTWLHAVLTGHVGLPLRVKETHFWGPLYYKGIQWYADHFRYCDPAIPAGEACPYFAAPLAPERIAGHIPDCKIIVILRDLVDRSYSQYRMLRTLGLVRDSFEAVVEKHPRIIDTNRYAFHLERWRGQFGADRVGIFLFDDLRADPQKFLDGICDFIGIDSIPLEGTSVRESDINSRQTMPRNPRTALKASRAIDWMHAHRMYRTLNFTERLRLWDFFMSNGDAFPPLSPETEARLREQFRPEVEAVEKLTGFNLSAWKTHFPIRPTLSEGVSEPIATHPD